MTTTAADREKARAWLDAHPVARRGDETAYLGGKAVDDLAALLAETRAEASAQGVLLAWHEGWKQEPDIAEPTITEEARACLAALIERAEREAEVRAFERAATLVDPAWSPRDEWRDGAGWQTVADAVAADIAAAIRAEAAKVRAK